jgi:hypothetical protein
MNHDHLRRAGRMVARWPFMCLGLVTMVGFLVGESGHLPSGLVELVRVLTVPMWLMRMIQMLVGIGSLPEPAQLLVAVPLLFLPYAGADWVLWRIRHRADSHRVAAV